MRGHIRPQGERSWAVVVDLGRDPLTGKRRRKWHTVRGTKRDADRALTKILAEVDANTYAEPSKLTLGEYLQRWLRDYAQPKTAVKTRERYTEIIDLHLVPALGHVRLSKLQPIHLQQYYAEALQAGRKDGRPGGLSAQTVLHHHRLLHKALETAVRWQLIGRNVADAVEPPRPERHEMKALTEDEITRLLGAARGHWLYVPILLAVTTGLREGEILGLRWQDVDHQAGTLAVRQVLQRTDNGLIFKEPKTQKSRRSVTLPAFVVEFLRRHREEQAALKDQLETEYQEYGLVCPRADGRPRCPTTVIPSLTAILSRAGLPRVRFHDLRHTHASLLLSQGVHPKVVSERLGHSTISITLDTYSHVLPGMQEEVARRLDSLFRR